MPIKDKDGNTITGANLKSIWTDDWKPHYKALLSHVKAETDQAKALGLVWEEPVPAEPTAEQIARQMIDAAAAAATADKGVVYTLPAGSRIYDGPKGGLVSAETAVAGTDYRDGEGVEIHIDLVNPIMGRTYWVENTAKWQTLAKKPERMRYQAWLNGDDQKYIRFDLPASEVDALLSFISSVGSPKTTQWMDFETEYLNGNYQNIIDTLTALAAKEA